MRKGRSALLLSACLGFLACSPDPATTPAVISPPASGQTPALAEAPRTEPKAGRPTSVQQVIHRPGAAASSDWVSCAEDEGVAPELRYTALRELEREDPERALLLALALLNEEKPQSELLRLNAIAVLARSDQPAAIEAIAALPESDRAVARRLAEVRAKR